MARRGLTKPADIEAAVSGNGSGDSQTSSPTPDEIAERAYTIYEREGRVDGKAMDHWLQAESELSMSNQKKNTPSKTDQDRLEAVNNRSSNRRRENNRH
jgi:hypothetical protein